MNRWARSGISLFMGFGFTVLAIYLEDGSLNARETPGTALGALNFHDYCLKKFGERATAVHPGVGAYGWRCWSMVDGLLISSEISTDDACALTYGAPAYSNAFNPDDPYGWECLRGPKPNS